MNPTRRRFLRTATIGALTVPSLAYAMGGPAVTGIALLEVPGATARPQAVQQLMWEVSKRTSIDVRERPITVSPDSDDLFDHPLIVWIGVGATAGFSEPQRARLRRWLKAGGLLFIDDASPPGDPAFDTSVRAELAQLWPEGRLQEAKADHTFFRTFFLLDRPHGRVRRDRTLHQIWFDDRSPILYSREDTFGAFGRDRLGRWLLPVVPGGAAQREMAFRTGVNLLMYATCLNYKRDQVHTTAILRRRRWRAKGR
jgi:hypothetical protein